MSKKYILGFLLIALSTVAKADVDETGKVTRILAEGNDIVSVWLSGTDVTTECAGGSRWTISTSDYLFKEKMATLLAAASSGTTVHLHHYTVWGCGTWDSNKIYYVDVSY